MSIWDNIEAPESPFAKGFVDKGYDSRELETQRVFATPEYNVISMTDETVFVTDETGAPHVFTIEEWERMKGGISPAGLFCAAAVLVGLGWLIF